MPGKPSARHRHDAGKSTGAIPSVGLALAGGGPLGGIYEVGVLIALSTTRRRNSCGVGRGFKVLMS